MKKLFFLMSLLLLGQLFFTAVMAESLSERLRGKILLQVEDKGQSWYVDKDTGQRAFLGSPEDALRVMRNFGLGISEFDFARFSQVAPSRLLGKILLRVESLGEAYYVNPKDKKSYFLNRPTKALELMRKNGLGITNFDLAQIPIAGDFGEKQVGSNKDNENTVLEEDNIGEEELGFEPEIGEISMENISYDGALITWTSDASFDYFLLLGKDSEKYNKEIKAEQVEDAEINSSFVQLEDLDDLQKYFFKIKVVNGQLEALSEEFSFKTVLKPRVLSVGETKTLRQVTVNNSWPRLRLGGDNYALLWHDGYTAFSQYNPNNNNFSKVFTFVGSGESAFSWNGSKYSVVWEKNCQINAAVINSLNKLTEEETSLVRRIGEGCPESIRLASDGEDFALVWSNLQDSGMASLYFKTYNEDARVLSEAVLLSQEFDDTVNPEFFWDGNNYLLAWQENSVLGEKKLLAVKLDSKGSIVQKRTIDDERDYSKIRFMDFSGKYQLLGLYGDDDEHKIGVGNFDGELDRENFTFLAWPNDLSGNNDVAVKKCQKSIGLAWTNSDILYFSEYNTDLELNSEIIKISTEDERASSPELACLESEYVLLWHSIVANTKSIKQIIIN